ncbi:unnamed protein product [Linum trigynum]|uniref:Uncharacterized protein n=1 Tax=Linum trigynum TaxID=586398 RepID=A0AAV2FPQ4_9ROSI
MGEAVTSRWRREDERWWEAEEEGGRGNNGCGGDGVKTAAGAAGAKRAVWRDRGNGGSVVLQGATMTVSV